MEARRRHDPKRSLLTAFAAADDEFEQEHAAAVSMPQDINSLEDDNDTKAFCKFHGRTGHATENCKHLMSNLMRMYHRGEIPPMDGDRSQGKSFPPKPPKSGQQEKRGRQPRPRKDAEKAEAPLGKRNRDDHDDLPPPPKRQVSMIMGGFLDNDDSISAIKEYERKVIAAQRYPYIHKGIPTISFTDKDASGLDIPHLDPLVITLQIHDCDVAKVLVDTGSTVNLIFLETLNRMGWRKDLSNLHPVPSPVSPPSMFTAVAQSGSPFMSAEFQSS
ncbi:unnamed protein product [Microthlaspi erraticum]|uniref:Retrotransposon gag domain-containing protein n=1 Tax=Microthlaspi erraticum TaxID=1685480 RepID=A0A6D2HZE1_9BRAS|nr:unnamed protein product [Microthlaspi erraticum]